MEITLEKIELVKDRTGVTYAEAKKVLEEADGSVVDAIISIEETVNAGEKGRGFGEKGEALFTSLKNLIKKGNVARVQVKRAEEIILNVPVNASIVGICIAPLASIVAVVAAFGFKCTIEVVKTDGTIIDISDAVTDTVSSMAEKGSDKADFLKEKGKEYYNKAKETDFAGKARENEFVGKAMDKAGEAADMVREKAGEVAGRMKKEAGDFADKVEDFADKVEDKVEDFADKVEDKAEEFMAEKEDVQSESDDKEE